MEMKRKLTKAEGAQFQKLLPHRYGQKFYGWAKAFYQTRNRQAFLVAANQIGKSSIQIRKMVEWAINKSLWSSLWPTAPRQFWYLYPNQSVATSEFELKWLPDFLPRGAMKVHPEYGWEVKYVAQKIDSLRFNSGVTIYFKTYSQQARDLQSGTVHYIGFDEELPADLYSELMMRLSAVDGYMSGVFTATSNQEFWRQVMEGKGEDEKLPDAFKLQVSKYDCLTFDDGTPGMYTSEKISREISMCKSQTEVQRRIYGKFVTEEGRKYPAFEYETHMVRPSSMAVPSHWSTYVGIDIGTGGASNHPAAIIFIAVNPLGTLGIVYDGWRGDGVVTTSEDILNKYLEMRQKNNVEPVQIYYDWHSKDFEIVATRAGISLTKANKAHEMGEDILNTLFKGRMLFIWDTEELRKLGNEIATLMNSKSKTSAKDDFCDALRYCSVGMPWDWNSIRSDAGVRTIEQKMVEARPLTQEEYNRWVECQRRNIPFDDIDKAEREAAKDSWEEFDEEIGEWAENYDQ